MVAELKFICMAAGWMDWWLGGQSSQLLIPHIRPSYRMGLSSGPSVAIIAKDIVNDLCYLTDYYNR